MTLHDLSPLDLFCFWFINACTFAGLGFLFGFTHGYKHSTRFWEARFEPFKAVVLDFLKSKARKSTHDAADWWKEDKP